MEGMKVMKQELNFYILVNKLLLCAVLTVPR